MTYVFEEEKICNYTGEKCHGDPNFCEECDVVLDSNLEKEATAK